MADYQRQQPVNATPFELAEAQVNDPWATLGDVYASIAVLDNNPPPDMLPYLVWQYGLGELAPYLPNLYDLISDGIQWQRIRGTPASIAKALGWLGFTATLEEEPSRRLLWNRFQLGFGSLPAADYPYLDRIDGVVSLSPPARSSFTRGYRGWDVRAAETGFQKFSAALFSDNSGVHLHPTGAKWSFGRDTSLAYELTEAELTSLGCWEVPSTAPVLWVNANTPWVDATYPWWDGYAQARRNTIVAALTAAACYVTFRDGAGSIIGYSRAICHGVEVASSGQYTIGATSYAVSASPAKALVTTRTPFNAADTAGVAAVDIAFNPVLASGVKPGTLWLAPAAVTSAVHVAQSAVSLTMAGTLREHVTFVLDIDTH